MIKYNNSYIPATAIKIIVFGTAVLTLLLSLLLVTYRSEIGSSLDLIILGGLVLSVYMGSASLLVYRNKYSLAGFMIIFFYFILSILILLKWGVGYAAGLLPLGFAIFLTGVISQYRYTAIATVSSIASIFIIYGIQKNGALPFTSDAGHLVYGLEDILTYACLFAAFGLTSQTIAMYIRKGFVQADAANAKLEKQKESLAILLEAEKRKLKNAHLEETRQLYRFAEIGQSTVAILHELSNQIGILNFDIEDLSEKSVRTKAIKNVRYSVKQINDMVIEARKRLQTRQRSERFEISRVINQVLKDNKSYIKSRGVSVDSFNEPSSRKIFVRGDPVDLAHVFSILIKNACEACAGVDKPKISISLSLAKHHASVSIRDNGGGVPESIKRMLFSPVKSTKVGGLGIGLYIAKHIVSSQFKGTLRLDDTAQTTFLVKMPVSK